MNFSQQLALHLQQVFFGGNWTTVNLKEQLSDLSLAEANTKMQSFNTIAALVYHIGYYVRAISGVLQGRPLDSKDAYSFDHPPFSTDESWRQFLEQTWMEAAEAVQLVQQLPQTQLAEAFTDDKYGSYNRNLLGLIEHTHYHLGQIVILKKLLRAEGQGIDEEALELKIQ